MPTNLTGNTIASTYRQLLHVDGGVLASEKTVYGGTGVATALKVGTQSVSVDNLKLDGNTLSSTDTNGNINLTPNGTGSVVIPKVSFSDAAGARTALGLGTMATQAASAVAITGGTLSGVTFSGSLSGLTDLTVDNLNLDGNTLSSTNTNGDINLTPNGTGSVVISKVAVTAGTVPYNTITNRAYAAFSDVTDQTGSVSAATAVKFGTTEIVGSGITMVTDGSNLTRLTFAVAGTYMVAPSLQFANSDAADHDVTVWLALNGTNVARSATKVTVPKTGDGGSAFFSTVFYVTVTAGQYVQVQWLPENVAVTLDHTAAGAIAPAIPSAIIVSERIA